MLSRRLPKDLEQLLFDLTLALYRVTDFFPPGEILRKHLREKANEIFSQALEYSYASDADASALKILGRIESVKGYLEIAKSLYIIRPINLVILEREYIFLADFFARELEFVTQINKSAETGSTATNSEIKPDSEISVVANGDPEKVVKTPPLGKAEKLENNPPSWHEFSRGGVNSVLLLNERQEAILEHLKQAERAKVSDFYSFFSNISSKTIQRDLQDLVAKNLLKREGEKRWTVYYLMDVNVH